MPSRHVSFRDKVKPDEVSTVTERVIKQVDSTDKVWVAAALHQHVRDNVEYDESVSAGYNRPPMKTYRKGGNCVDLAILLCSLFRSVDIGCRLISLGGGDIGHMTAAVTFLDAPRAVTDALTGYYCEHNRLCERTYTWFEDEYFIADRGSRYIGDVEPLKEYTTGKGQFIIEESIEIVD